jgi:uncharacterized protein YraI
MHTQPQRTLKRLLKQYGPDLVNDPRRTEALLNDHCGQHRREIFVLVNAQKQRVPAELLAAPGWMPRQAVWSRLSRQLQEKLALTPDAAEWAVAAWASALDLTPANGKSPWFWANRTSQAAANATAPSANGSASSTKGKQKKRQSTSVGVNYSIEPARKSKRRSSQGDQATFRRNWRLLSWPVLPVLRKESLTRLAGWSLLFVLSLTLLALVLTELRQPHSLADPAAGAASVAEIGSSTLGGVRIGEDALGAPQTAVDYLTAAYALPRIAWVTEGPLLVRQGPSTDDPWQTTLDARAAVTVDGVAENGGWSHIQTPAAGWVSNDYLSFMTDGEPKVMVQLHVRQMATPTTVVVRAAPTSDAALVGEVAAGSSIVAIATTLDGAWHQVVQPLAGWVAVQELPVAP